MVVKLLIAGLLALPLAAAFSIVPLISPDGSIPVSGQLANCTWSAGSTDPQTFSLQLVNSMFHDTYAIASDVESALQSMQITLPLVPTDSNYQIEAIDPGNVNSVYAISSTFTILGQSTSTTSSSSVTSTTSGTSSVPSTVSTTPGSLTQTITPATTVAGTGTATGATTTPTSFNSGAQAVFTYAKAPAVVALLAVAGAALVL